MRYGQFLGGFAVDTVIVLVVEPVCAVVADFAVVVAGVGGVGA